MRSALQRGFTLIELVVVIIILGILAAFAVPRFMGLDQQARIASVNSLVGTLRSAAAMAHGVWLAQGAPAAAITIDGQAITFTNGYPNAASIALLLDEIAGYYEREVDYRLKTLSAAFEPILIGCVGGLVLILALGVFLPMWNLIAKIGSGH